jgi:hypothetical protein
MSLQDTKSRAFRPPYFVPAWQESDHTVLYDHQSSVMAVGTVVPISIPKGVNALLVQAIGQNIRYVLVGTPSPTSGFRLTAGNDPIAIPVVEGMTVQFVPEAAGASLEMQFGNL